MNFLEFYKNSPGKHGKVRVNYFLWLILLEDTVKTTIGLEQEQKWRPGRLVFIHKWALASDIDPLRDVRAPLPTKKDFALQCVLVSLQTSCVLSLLLRLVFLSSQGCLFLSSPFAGFLQKDHPWLVCKSPKFWWCSVQS